MIRRQIPNLITLGNLFCGVESLFASLARGDVRMAAIWICAGIFLDFFDGLAARLLKVPSELGKQLDSLADVVTSGVAPAFLMFRLVEVPLKEAYPLWVVILCMLPFLLMLPTVITGQISILMILAYMLTALGPIYCMLFQLAIINKNTLPLNEKITGKNQLGNKWQSILSLVSMFVPIIFVFLFEAIFDTTIAYTLLIVIGLAFTLTEPYWMRNIYVRMMRRRYTNLEGFHASR